MQTAEYIDEIHSLDLMMCRNCRHLKLDAGFGSEVTQLYFAKCTASLKGHYCSIERRCAFKNLCGPQGTRWESAQYDFTVPQEPYLWMTPGELAYLDSRVVVPIEDV